MHQITEFPHQITEFPMAVSQLKNKIQLNPLKRKLDVRLLNSEYAWKSSPGKFPGSYLEVQNFDFSDFVPKIFDFMIYHYVH